MARLILSLGGQILAEYNMSKERYTIGRLPDNDVRIDNPAVSGHHSLIINILSDSFLEDLSSTNGTYVNGKLVKKHALQSGDVITVGHHQMKFVDSDVEAEDSDDEFVRTMIIDSSPEAVQEAGAAAFAAATAADSATAPPPPASAVAGSAGREMDTIRSDSGTLTEETPRSTKTAETQRGPAPPMPVANAKVQVLSGKFAGREIDLKKALTTLGSKGVQVVAITKRSDGYCAVQVDNKRPDRPACLNGNPLSSNATRLNDGDVLEIIGIKMGFFMA